MIKRAAHFDAQRTVIALKDEAVRLDQPLAVGPLWLESRVLLAPLSGITDVPFRKLVRRFGVGLVYSEMVASGELLKGTGESIRRCEADGGGHHAVQLAGRDPVAMRDAARLLTGEGADLLDINFGCPAKKVTGGLCGSALMREPELALKLVEACVDGAGDVPVTVKMRLGWDRSNVNAPALAIGAVEAGARLVTVHGRTRAEFYEGRADWPAIAAVAQAVAAPVVANGDIATFADAARALVDSEADAVMIGRGACGRPWFPALLAKTITLADLEAVAFDDLACAHYEAMLAHYGVAKGLRHARKHLGWYLDGLEGMSGESLVSERADLLRGTEPGHVLALLLSVARGVTAAAVESAYGTTSRKAAA